MAPTKTVVPYAERFQRVVVLVDMDCFYCQVERKLNPTLVGRPVAVVQYNAWKGGGIIAVNYEAREKGVTRHMRGEDAKEHCPEIELVSVPSVREKADLSKYRNAGRDVANVLQTFTPLLERASVDEAYLDITEQVIQRVEELNEGKYQILPEKLTGSYVVGYDDIGQFITEAIDDICGVGQMTENGEILVPGDEDDYNGPDVKQNIMLLVGATIANDIRRAVKEQTGYNCSAGIAHNKILAKLACGINKPNKQTVLTQRFVPDLFRELPLGKIRGLGGKFGQIICETLNVKHMGDLERFTLDELQSKFNEKNGLFLYQIVRGVDLERVSPKFNSKSIGCCKKFPGRTAIISVATLNHWLSELSAEVYERIQADIDDNNRQPTQITLSFTQTIKGRDVASTRSTPLTSLDPEDIKILSSEILKKNTQQFTKTDNPNKLEYPILFLGISVGKFKEINQKNAIMEMFNNNKKISTAEVSGNAENEATVLTEEPSENSILVANKLDDNFTLTTTNNEQEDRKKLDQPSGCGNSFFQKHFNKIRVIKESSINKEIISLPKGDESEVIAMASCSTEKSENFVEKQLVVSKSPIPSTSSSAENQFDYMSTYAEFYRPPAVMIKCEECGKEVDELDMLSHMDFHLAMKLSKEENNEYRTQICKKRKQSPEENNNKLNRKRIQCDTIDSFLIRSSQPLSQRKINCAECNNLIFEYQLEEHMNMHAIRKAHLELNPHLICTPIAAQSKGGKNLKRQKSANNLINHSTIDTFLKRK